MHLNPNIYPPRWGSRTFVMGILNITPDSFSGDGLMQQSDLIKAALEQARQFLAGGADILDVGGESTRPGSQLVGADEEMQRILPVIEALHKEAADVVISVDTYKSEVAEAALQAGAQWVNDIWGLRADPNMAQVVARQRCPVILMHNRSKPAHAELQEKLGGRYVGMQYDDLLEDVKGELLESIKIARDAGIVPEN
jgi:dihydropteroate synthase